MKKLIKPALFSVLLFLIIYTRGFPETLVFFSSILLHEAFHILTSAVFGFRIQSFGLGAFGFRFGCEAPPPSGVRGALIYLSGPAANLALAALIGVINYYSEMPMGDFIIFYNLVLFAVNMIPAYPMDAARALTMIISKYMGSVSAVKCVSTVSYMISALMFVAGIFVALAYRGNMLLSVFAIVIASNTRKEKAVSVINYLKNIKI